MSTQRRASCSPEPLGTVVLVCHGHRCANLWRLAEEHRAEECTADVDQSGGRPVVGGWDELRVAVRTTRQAVLLRSPCMSRCEVGAVVGLGRGSGATRPGEDSAFGPATTRFDVVPTAVLWTIQDDRRCAALCRWIVAGGQEAAALPAELVTGR